MVGLSKVTKPTAWELKALDILEGVPGTIDFFHSMFCDQLSEMRVHIASTVRREVKLKRIIVLVCFHSLNQPLIFLHQAQTSRFG